MSHYEILKLLAKEFDMPKEQIEIIVADFWSGVKGYLENPFNSFIKGVTIKGFITFELRSEHWLKKRIDMLERNYVQYKNSTRMKSEKEINAGKVEAEKLKTIIKHKQLNNG